MRVAVLSSPDSWYFNDLARAAGHDFQLECVPFDELAVAITKQGSVQITAGRQNLATFDAVLVRTMPPGSLEQVVFRMDALTRLEAQGVAVLNSAKSLETAVDKFLTSAKLVEAGLPTPRTVVCQTVNDAMAALVQLGGDVVVKPLFGSEGRGITRLNDEALAQRAFSMLVQLNAVLYVQEFIAHRGYDCRLLVVGEEIYSMQRSHASDWRTNVSRGATTQPYSPTAELMAMARRAADAVGASIAGVDLLPSINGTWYVLEVNAVPGWKALSRTIDVDIGRRVLDFIASHVRRNSP